MTKKSLSLALLISLFAIAPSITFAMKNKNLQPDLAAAAILKLTKPGVDEFGNETLVVIHNVLDNTATVNAGYLLLMSTSNELSQSQYLCGNKSGWAFKASLTAITALTKTDYAKTVEKKVPYLEKLNTMYPWLPGILRGAGAHGATCILNWLFSSTPGS